MSLCVFCVYVLRLFGVVVRFVCDVLCGVAWLAFCVIVCLCVMCVFVCGVLCCLICVCVLCQ